MRDKRISLRWIPGLIILSVLLVACGPEQPVKPEPVVPKVDPEIERQAREKEATLAMQRYEEMVKRLEVEARLKEAEEALARQQQAAPEPQSAPAAKTKQAVKPKPASEAKPAAAPPPERKQTYRSGAEVAGQNRLYDRDNPNYDMIQKANQALKGFPTNRIGEVDWMAAINSGKVKPRSNVAGTLKPELLNLDVIMKNTRGMPYVRFPHLSHTKWLACKNCHDGIFKKKIGAHVINMNEIFQGRYCGVCHDKVAFSVYICENCHSVPH